MAKHVRAAAAAAALLTALSLPLAALDVAPAECYWYNVKHTAVAIPDAYALEQTVDPAALTGAELSGLTDSFLAPDGRLYLLDASGKIVILDEGYAPVRVLDRFTQNGEPLELNAPEGLFVSGSGVIYIADTQNGRVVLTNDRGEVSAVFGEPENLTGFDGELSYLPSKLAVDSAGRLFVVVRNVNMGIVVLDPRGRFITYRGAPSVTLSLFDAFWRRFSTEEQRERMKTYVPTEYNNLTIDGEDFLYGTISALDNEVLLSAIRSNDNGSRAAQLKKLNLAGEDILRRQGMYPPIGDLVTEEEGLSSFVDVALSDCGVYTVLDGNKGRLFTYDDDGELLFVFGGVGQRVGQFSQPVAVAYRGDRLLVCDGYTNSVYCFAPTAYGSLVLKAVKDYYNGDYESSYDCWGRVLEYNSNLSLAYVGVGKAHYQEKEYDEAMECFRIAGDVKSYSMAYRKVRNALVRSWFAYIVIGILIIVAVAVAVGLFRKFRRYCDEE